MSSSFSFSFSSATAGDFIGVMFSFALEIYSNAMAGVDANGAVLLCGVLMLISIYRISRSNTSKSNLIETGSVQIGIWYLVSTV